MQPKASGCESKAMKILKLQVDEDMLKEWQQAPVRTCRERAA